jgi:hypothetical protein
MPFAAFRRVSSPAPGLDKLLDRFQKNCALLRKRGHKIPRGFGLRQPSAAFLRAVISKSGRGLPQSKTLARGSVRSSPLTATDFLKPLQKHAIARRQNLKRAADLW